MVLSVYRTKREIAATLLRDAKERDVSQAVATIRAHLKRSEEYLLLHWSLTHEGQRS